MKLAPVYRALRDQVRQTVVHTGQHYDPRMSAVFFEQLDIREPDVNLRVGSGTHAWQTGTMMIGLEPVLANASPDLVLVYGDVNSTAAAALVCSKLRLPFGHVEAGLRSHDRTMPEEANRIVTDALADLHFTPSVDANRNLLGEGVPPDKVYFVGNVMIDSLVSLLPRVNPAAVRSSIDVGMPYVLVTLHRPSLVDDPAILGPIVSALSRIARSVDVVWPVHPRRRDQLARIQVDLSPRMRLVGPMSYLEFLALEREAGVVVTDSGGVQEETTFLGVPCLTLRENTERPVTVALGTNQLLGHDAERLVAEVGSLMANRGRKGSIPPLWDGKAARRIADIVVSHDVRASRGPQSASLATRSGNHD